MYCIRSRRITSSPSISIQESFSNRLLPNSNTVAPSRLLNISHLLSGHFQVHFHSPTTSLVHVLDLLPLLDVKCLALTLSINPPFGFERNTRVPASDRCVRGPAGHVNDWRRLAVESGLVAGSFDDVFPEVASCC